MTTQCPICGRPFSTLDLVLAEHDVTYQCHHCWNRVQATGAGAIPSAVHKQKKPRIVSRAAQPRARKTAR